ncbi:MAG: hypothetical protein KF700_04470 [Hyphomonadaceae bacterium]|nr:hypothetical protein [Hyphomonadaceae bacterium]
MMRGRPIQRCWDRLFGRAGRRAAFSFAALAAIALQAFAIQTHIHPAAPVASAESTLANGGDHSAPAHAEALHTPPGCILCAAAAASSGVTLAARTALLAPARILAATPTPLLAIPPPARTHLWRSRAPPIAL